MGFVTLRVVCFSCERNGHTARGVTFCAGTPPAKLPRVYRFFPPAYSRAAGDLRGPARRRLHIARGHPRVSTLCHTMRRSTAAARYTGFREFL